MLCLFWLFVHENPHNIAKSKRYYTRGIVNVMSIFCGRFTYIRVIPVMSLSDQFFFIFLLCMTLKSISAIVYN